jgi:hypothetical protein
MTEPGNDTGPALMEADSDFETITICNTILDKVSELTAKLYPVLKPDDETTPDAREGSPIIQALQAIDGYLTKLMSRVDM